MANIIDQLLVTLGLDASGMKKGADDAAKAQEKIKRDAADTAKTVDATEKRRTASTAAETKKRAAEEEKARKAAADAARRRSAEEQKQAKQTEQSFNKARNEILSMAAAYLGFSAMKGLGEQVIQADAHLNRMSGTLGVAAEDLNAWEMSAAKAQVGAADLEAAFRSANEMQLSLAGTGEEAMQKMQAYVMALRSTKTGRDVQVDQKLYDKNLGAQERLLELAKETHDMSLKDATLALSKLGISEGVARYLHQGNVELAAQLQHAKDLDPNFKAAADGSSELVVQWQEAKNKFKGLADTILVDLLPAIKSVLRAFEGLFGFAERHLTATEVLLGATTVGLTAMAAIPFLSLISGLRGVIAGLGATKTAATEAAAEIGAVNAASTKSIGLLGKAGMVGAAGAAGYALGTLLADGIDLVITKLTGADASLGTFLHDWFAAKQKGPTDAANDAFAANEHIKKMKAQNAKIMGSDTPVPSHAKSPSGVPEEVTAAAVAAQVKYGIPADVTIAQWKLESASGKRMPIGSNNPFGIKAKAGQPYVEAETNEFVDGQMVRVKQRFAKFDSLADAFDAHAQLLANGKAYAEARRHEDDPRAFADALTGHYATDPDYGAKLKALMPGPALDPGLTTGAAASVSNSQVTNAQSATSNSVATHVGQVTINAPAAQTNKDVAVAMGDQLNQYTQASLANYGMR